MEQSINLNGLDLIRLQETHKKKFFKELSQRFLINCVEISTDYPPCKLPNCSWDLIDDTAENLKKLDLSDSLKCNPYRLFGVFFHLIDEYWDWDLIRTKTGRDFLIKQCQKLIEAKVIDVKIQFQAKSYPGKDFVIFYIITEGNIIYVCTDKEVYVYQDSLDSIAKEHEI